MKLQHAMSPTQLQGRRVFVYKNLHEDCWSVKDRETGHVVAHADRVELSNVELKVSQAGRRRVLEEKRKNVHAGLVGVLEGLQLHGSGFPGQRYTIQQGAPAGATLVTYNPYKYETFVSKANETPILRADTAVLAADGRSVWVQRPSA